MLAALQGFSHGLKTCQACFLNGLSNPKSANKKKGYRKVTFLFLGRTMGFVANSFPMGKNCKEWPGPNPARNSPPDCFIQMVRIPFTQIKRKDTGWYPFFFWQNYYKWIQCTALIVQNRMFAKL